MRDIPLRGFVHIVVRLNQAILINDLEKEINHTN